MKKKLLKLEFLLCSFLLTLFFIPINITAAEVVGSFSAKLNFPENQIEKDKGYYYLKMQPGQKQKISIDFMNSGKEKTIVDIELNSAKTNSNGVLEYGDTNIKNDKSLKFDFKDIFKGPKNVELNPGETKKVEFEINMPETQFDGQIAGGIQLVQRGQNTTTEQNGSVVLNEYAYVYAVLLQESEVKVKPELQLNSVKAGQSNYKNSVFINYSNVKPAYVDNMTTEVQITKKGEQTVLYEKKQAKMRMAPNTYIDFPVSMGGEAMVPGDYTAKILVTADNGIKEEWSKDFKITKEEADKFNERDVGLVQDKGFDFKIVIFIVLGFILLVVIFYVLMNIFSKNKDKSKSKKKSKKKNRN